MGKYSHECFQILGKGQFRPNAGANLNIGVVGQLEEVDEVKADVFSIDRSTMQKSVLALKNAYSYEEVAL